MRKCLSTALAGMLLLSLPTWGRTQKEVEPPAVPPMLEGQRPLEQLEPKKPASPAPQEVKTKPKGKGKSGKKTQVKAGKTEKKKKTVGKAGAKKNKKNGKTAKSTKKKSAPAIPTPEPVPDNS
ncbi:MAG: hypothetical protein FJ128_12365 [Deltaproteobacteria bacterium]|nr:hypothetical protein [Deltaproteobacteria bacterium]